MELTELTTEIRNEKSKNIDQMNTIAMLRTINNEDKTVAYAVEKVLEDIAVAVDQIYIALSNGGRLFYVGAGTSCGLGVMYSSECVPSFMVSEEMIQTVIAGGEYAMIHAADGTIGYEVT